MALQDTAINIVKENTAIGSTTVVTLCETALCGLAQDKSEV